MSPVLPTLSFLIPSLHDGVQLECRIYHPPVRNVDHGDQSDTIAIVAHPYAPLGGCYDVPVVLGVVKALLKEHITVGTFNFRGAGASRGRTSWTGKAEIVDYESFLMFFLFYMTSLRNGAVGVTSTPSADVTTTGLFSFHQEGGEPLPSIPLKLVLAGYSYGSLIVTHLPAIEDVISNNLHLPIAKYMSELVATSRSLAAQAIDDLRKTNHQHNHIRIGSGDENSHVSRHSSIRSVDVIKHLPHSPHFHRNSSADKSTARVSISFPLPTLPKIETCYLLVSPILPPVSYTVMLPLGRNHTIETAWQKHPTFAIFGDRDGFSSIKKLTPWAQALATAEHTHFQYAAVTGAGHFWIEEGVAEKMKNAIVEWIRCI